MKQIWLIGLLFVGLEGLLFFVTQTSSPVRSSSIQPDTELSSSNATSSAATPDSNRPLQASSAQAIDPAVQELQYQVYSLTQAEVHTVRLPAQSPHTITAAIADGVDTLEGFSATFGAIAVLNGGFFDPVNQKTTSYVVSNGQPVADPQQNERLINNPDLIPYLDRILNRSEFRHYQCGQTTRYDITLHADPLPEGCQLVDAVGGGPNLLPDLTLEQEGFLAIADGVVIRDSLNNSQPNARTALGITGDGSVLWVMVAQKPDAPATSGMSLPSLADFLQTLGVEKAINLDGGGSSSLYFNGKTIYGDVDEQGNPIQRPVHSVLLIR